MYLSLEKEHFCVEFTYFIKFIKLVSCHSHATTAKKCTKKRDAHVKLLFCRYKPIAFG